jgi:exopolyphosphatase/guanosine-5'-triphosphate,3'-diphosphate pyrophosphatase
VRVAVLDLGSTSFRLVVADWIPDKGLVPQVQGRERLNLGKVVGREGRIPKPHASAAAKAAAKLRRRAERAGSDRVVAVATSALRDARNRGSVVRRLEAAAGTPVRILSGDEEAALTLAAMRAALPLGEDRVLGVDLGGGSLELAIGSGARLEWTASLELGASRLVGSFVRHDPLPELERARLVSHVESTLRPLPSGDAWPSWCVAAGGSVKALARLLVASGGAAGPLNGVRLDADHLQTVASRLLSMGRSERRRMPGMDRHREDVLGAAALVVAALLRRVGLGGVTVSEWGLREGVILEALGLSTVEVPAPPCRRSWARRAEQVVA